MDRNIIIDWRLFDLFDVFCPILCSTIGRIHFIEAEF
jgi:hypothetical protein